MAAGRQRRGDKPERAMRSACERISNDSRRDRGAKRRRACALTDAGRGDKVTDLPVVQATKFDLVINLKTAKALGIAVPPLIFAIADEARAISRSGSPRPMRGPCRGRVCGAGRTSD
jgi:hypothetical protein